MRICRCTYHMANKPAAVAARTVMPTILTVFFISFSCRRAITLHLAPTGDRLGDRRAVHVLEVASHRNSARQSGDTGAERANLPFEIDRGRFAFHARVRGHDHLSD